MAIQITSLLAARLRDEMREHPLDDGEIRRLVGLGRHHIARASTDIATQGFAWLYALKIDEQEYLVCVPDVGKTEPR